MRNVNLLSLLLLAGLSLASCKNQPEKNKYRTQGSLEILDPLFEEIIDPASLPEIIADSFAWTEGPLWIAEHQMLIWSVIPENKIMKWTEKNGHGLYLEPSGYTGSVPRGGETGSNGLLLDPDGNLVLCQHGDRRMARMDAPLDSPEAKFITLSDRWEGKRFNSPNDAVFHSNGDLYFTDPAYGMEFGFKDPKREIDFAGVYRLTADGKTELMIDSIEAPNGIGLSPDETKLYVASSGSDCSWYTYVLDKYGTPIQGEVLYNAKDLQTKYRVGSPDGLEVRRDGIIFGTGPGGLFVFSPEGKLLGIIVTGEHTSNVSIDYEGKYLYFTSNSMIMRIPFK